MFILSLILFGAISASALATDGTLADRVSWLSQVPVNQWRSPFGPNVKGEHLSSEEPRKFEALLSDADLSQSSSSFLRYQHGTTKLLGAFGSLATFYVRPQPASRLSVKRLTKIGLDRQSREDLFGPQGSLSVSSVHKSLADPDLIVRGVNDDLLISNDTAPQERDSQRSSMDMPTSPPDPDGRRRIVDASEGTPLDPLLNTTYDLNYPKVVPSMKNLSRYLQK